jgi:hypothetical protein
MGEEEKGNVPHGRAKPLGTDGGQRLGVRRVVFRAVCDGRNYALRVKERGLS